MNRQQRVEQLFHDALALEPGARTRFLAEVCATDPGLLKEVRELISAHEELGSFIDRPAYHGFDLDDDRSDSLIGTSLGRYKVIRLIKRSGMGEVYLARDTHLPRDVALKLLPLMFTGDENRLRRFILEAEAASSLNHPNILTIYEIGHVHDVHYIAAEFVDGQTLRERLGNGKLEMREALDVAIGVTNALVASHAAGIVHRDIKPENIMIRHDGYVKVLDFGLAKLTQQADVRIDGDTRMVPAMDTDPGTFMGTVGYLSPEQANLLEVDNRSDLFSLGVVLYETVTGENPFNRYGFREVIDAILRAEPAPLTSLIPDTPALLQKIVAKTLSKDKLDRYQRTEDLLADLKAVQAELGQQILTRKVTLQKRWRLIATCIAAVVALTVLGAGILIVLNRDRSSGSVSDSSSRLRFSEVHSWRSERGESGTDARFSHDGRMVTFTMRRNHSQGIWVKQPSSEAEARQITRGDTDNYWPIWSPDDQQIAFVSTRAGQTGIWSILVNGGSEKFLVPFEMATVRTRDWSKDGKTIYYEMDGKLFGLDVASRTTRQLTQFKDEASFRGHFSVSPAENQICYVAINNGQTDIWVASLDGESAVKVTDDVAEDRRPIWHPDGRRIVFTSNRGGALQICVGFIDGTRTSQLTVGTVDHALSDISQDGTRLLDMTSRDEASVFGLDLNKGSELELASGSGLKLWPEVSPDGETIVFQSAASIDKVESDATIAIKRATNEGPTLALATNGFGPSWFPDGSRVAFLRRVSGKLEIFSISRSGGDQRQLTRGGVSTNGYNLLPTTKFGRSLCWSGRGDKIIYSSRKSGVSNLWAVAIDGSTDTQISTNTDPTFFIYEPICGPRGQVAYAGETRGGNDWSWSLWVYDGEKSKRVFHSTSLLRPIGWSDTEDEFIAAVISSDESEGNPKTVRLRSVSVNGNTHAVSELQSTYFWTVQLAPDGRRIAFVSSRDGADNVWSHDLAGSGPEKLTSNNEPKTYIPDLSWSAMGQLILYSKETSLGLITIIDNFD